MAMLVSNQFWKTFHVHPKLGLMQRNHQGPGDAVHPQGTPQRLLIGRILGAAAPVKSAHIKPWSWGLYQLYPTLW